MGALLKIRDEYFGTAKESDPAPFELRLVSERTTPGEIIRQRVTEEVETINRRRHEHFEGHLRTRSFLIAVDPASAEGQLNKPDKGLRGFVGRARRPKLIDAGQEVEKALAAFAANRFVMLFDDRQVDGLEMPLFVTPDSEVTFIHLMPLKGG